MNKRELVNKMASDAELTKTQASKALDAFIEVVQDSLVNGQRVTLVGFGTFLLTRRKARQVKDPRGGTVQLAPRRVARFAPGLELKSAINKAHNAAAAT